VNKLKPYQVFEDDRGKLIGIMNDAQWEEFNYLETKAGNVRGNHYHEHTRELFFIIEGRGKLEISIKNGKTVSYDFKEGEIILIEPGETHTIHCLVDTKWINALSTRFDTDNPDIKAGKLS